MSNEIIQVLIIDDNCDICDLLSNYFNLTKDIKVVGIANNGIDGYEMMKQLKPDIVLLDLIMPYMDGMSFLEKAKTESIINQQKIIMVSEISQESIVRHAFYLGTHYFILKPFDLKFLGNRIRNILRNSEEIISQKEILRPVDAQSRIAKLVIDSGIPVHTDGYKYFTCALNFLIEEKSDVFAITKSVYPYVASAYDTSSSCVDKSMRHSLRLAHSQNHEMLATFLDNMSYQDNTKVPSNSQFINLIMARMKNDSLVAMY